MKKFKNILFLLIAVFFCTCLKVDAASVSEEAYDLKWNKSYIVENEEDVFYSVIEVDGGTVSAGYRWFCEVVESEEKGTDLKATSNCIYSALIVKHDKDGNVVWTNDLYDENVTGVDSVIYDLVLADDKIIAIVEKSIINDSGDDEYSVELVEFTLDGKMEDVVLLADEGLLFYPHLSYRNELIGVGFNDSTLIFNKTLELAKDLDSNLIYPAIEMTDDGIYVAGNDYDNIDMMLYKYDYDYNLVSSKVLVDYDEENENLYYEIEVVSDMEFYKNDLSIVSMGLADDFGSLFLLDEEFNIIKTKKYDNSYPYALVQSRNGLAVLELVSNLCPSSSMDSINDFEVGVAFKDVNGYTTDVKSSCGDEYLLVKYDADLNELWNIELAYYPFQLARVDSGIVVSGYSYDYSGVVEKYYYDDYNILTNTDGNGTVTSSKTVSASGEVIEFTVTPKEGYTLKKVVVTTVYGDVVEFVDYKFTMPSEDVEIYAEFEVIVSNPNTGLSNPYIICGIILGTGVVGYTFLKKKKYI